MFHNYGQSVDKNGASAAGICLVALIVLFFCTAITTRAQGRNQKWLDDQRALLAKEQTLQNARIEDFNRAAQTGLKETVSTVLDWVKDKGNGVIGISDPVLLLQTLIAQNLDMYTQALHGDWDAYKESAADLIYGKIVDQLPEKLDFIGELPTIIKLSLDVKRASDLRTAAQKIDDIGEGLKRVQLALDQAQKQLLADAARQSRKQKETLIQAQRRAAIAEKNYSELDKAIAEMTQRDMNGINSSAVGREVTAPVIIPANCKVYADAITQGEKQVQHDRAYLAAWAHARQPDGSPYMTGQDIANWNKMIASGIEWNGKMQKELAKCSATQ